MRTLEEKLHIRLSGAEYKINRSDTSFDHQGSSFEGTLAAAQDQAAFSREVAKIHECGCVRHAIPRERGGTNPHLPG